MVSLLVFGTGPIAARYPQLAAQLNADRNPPKVTRAQVAAFTQQLLAVDPQFHQIVTLGVQKSDPYAAQAALARLNTDIAAWEKEQNVTLQKNLAAQPQGTVWLKQTVLVGTTAVGVWQALVFTTAAVLGEAVVVVAIVPAAVSYQFEYTHADKIEVTNWAAGLATSLG